MAQMFGDFFHLLPGLVLQIALAAALLWLFTRPSDDVPVTHILLTSLGFSFLNMGIEWALRDYLLEAIVVVQWTFFVLLANHFLSIPLPRAALTLFCFFSLMLGSGLLDARLSQSELSEEERLLVEGFQAVEVPEAHESEPLSPWAIQIRNGILDKRLVAARSAALRSLYAKPEPEVAEQPNPMPDPTPETASVSPVLSPSSTMTGNQFEALFTRVSPADFPTEQEIVSETPESSGSPDRMVTEKPEPRPTDEVRPDRRNHPGGFNAEQLSEVVEVRNRSTDRRFANPQFDVGAVSMGEHGRFAIVDGEMLKEGSIVRTNQESPRGWKLHRIEPTELFWQPLK